MHLSFQESPTDLKVTFKSKNKEKQISCKAKLLQTCQNKPARRGLVVSHFYCTIGVGVYFVSFFSSLPFCGIIINSRNIAGSKVPNTQSKFMVAMK